MVDQNDEVNRIQEEISSKLKQLSAALTKMSTTTGDKTSSGFGRDIPFSRFIYSKLGYQIREMNKSFASSVRSFKFSDFEFDDKIISL